MDPGDKSTILMSLDIGKSRILTMRSLTKTRTNREPTPTAFRLVLSACKLNLLLCHHKIMFYKITRFFE